MIRRLLPLLAFIALARRCCCAPACGMNSGKRHQRRIPVAADRQAGAGLRAAGAATTPQRIVTLHDLLGSALPAQRLGQLVPGLPRRASGDHATCAQAGACAWSATTTRTTREDALRWLRAVRQSLRADASPTTKAAPRSTGASTARRKPSWSTPSGIVRWKHVGPIDRRRSSRRADPGLASMEATPMTAAISAVLLAAAAAAVHARRAVGRCAPLDVPRRRRGSALPRAGRRTALRDVPEPVAGRLQRADRARPAPRGAGADARRASPTRRSSSTWSQRYSDFVLYKPPVRSRAPGCCGSARSCCCWRRGRRGAGHRAQAQPRQPAAAPTDEPRSGDDAVS